MDKEEILYRVYHVVAAQSNRKPWDVEPTDVLGGNFLRIKTPGIPSLRSALERDIRTAVPRFNLPPTAIDSSLTVAQVAANIDKALRDQK